MTRTPPGPPMPRCANCGCRRIYHTRPKYSGPKHDCTEAFTPCSAPVDGKPCNCRDYQPVAWSRA